MISNNAVGIIEVAKLKYKFGLTNHLIVLTGKF